MEGIQIIAFAPILVIILCTSVGNCCMTRGLRATIQHLEQRIYNLESVKSTPRVILTPPPQLPPSSSYYYPSPPYPSAPHTSYTV